MFYPQHQTAFAALLADLKSDGRQIAVIGHNRPDGDCIGSQVGLARVLRALGLRAFCVNGDKVPHRLRYIVGDTPFYLRTEMPEGDYAAVYVDCGDLSRAGEPLAKKFPTPLGNIDHHLNNPTFGKHNIVDTPSAAACEILTGLFLDAGLVIDEIAAKALYAGIATDTGQFRFNSTSRRTFELAAALVDLGAKPSESSFNLYEQEPRGKLQLLQRFLASFAYECDGRVCIGTLPRGIYEETKTNVEDTEGMVDYTRCIEGVDIGVLIEEREGGVKASLRSKNPEYRVDQIAAKFGGGGHACAAGINLKNETSENFRRQLVAALGETLAKIPPGA